MKRTMKKMVSLGLVAAISLTMLVGCGNSKETADNTASDNTANDTSDTSVKEETKTAENAKIGVLVQDVSGEEALGFRTYYEDYVANQYGVTFTYTDELKDAASEKSAIEKFASQGYQAVISLSSNDRALQIETCEENQIYYAVAAGTLDQEQFEKYKTNEYFLGQVGPSMDTEYEAGVEMGRFFAEKGIKTAAIYGAFIPNPMHVYRVAGVLSGLGLSYDGATEEGEVVGKIFTDQSVDLSKISGDIQIVSYLQGYNTDFPNKLIPATLSSELLKGLLRKKLGFNGLIVTDSTCMVGFSCAMNRERAVPYAIEAGCDMFLFNKDLEEDYQYMLNGYKQGILSEQRLDEAITRILATKASLGLHRKAKCEIVPSESALCILQADEHVAWAKKSADKAVTLVKDIDGILPLNPHKTKKVLLEIIGGFPSNERVLESFRKRLVEEGFEVNVYEQENFETAKFDVGTFRKNYDLVIYIGNVENASNKVTNRLSWYTFWGNGNNVPWFAAERPVVFISLANPYHLVDVPMIKTFINGYSNSEYVIDSVMEKLMGRSNFTGKSPVDPFCGKEYLKW